MDGRSTSIQMLVTYLVILAVCLERVQSTCGGYTQEQCADSSTMHQFKRCVHKVFHACLKRHPLKRDPHEENVGRDLHGLNMERDPHGMSVKRDPQGMNVERDPQGMNMERDPNRTPVLCNTIVYVWKKERFCHVKCFWIKYKVPHYIRCAK
eukprot:TCONS_00048398-protein